MRGIKSILNMVRTALAYILIVMAGLILPGCATQENQQIILSNLANSKAQAARDAAFYQAIQAAKDNPTAVVAISLEHAHAKGVRAQRVETVRGYLTSLGDTFLRYLPFFGGGGDRKKNSDNVSAGRDVIINSDKHDNFSAGMGIDGSINRDGNTKNPSYSTSEEVVFAPEEEAPADE